MELKEKLLLIVTESSVKQAGVNIRSNDVHADAIIDLVNKIVEKLSKEK